MEDNRKEQISRYAPAEDREDDAIRIDFYLIGDYLKRFFVLWLALAVALGSIAAAFGMWAQSTTYSGDAKALIGFEFEGAENGLDPNGQPLDVSKISSPMVVTEAMNGLGLDLLKLDNVRTNLKISGVIADDKRDELNMLYSILASKGSADMVQTLLDVGTGATRYIVSFDYLHAGISRDMGVELLNEIVNSYRTYFDNTYNYNLALGSAVNVIDYRDYDYAEAVNIFSNTLKAIEEYITAVQSSQTTDFRSSETGYSFADLLATTELLKEVELDRISSYVVINSVTKSSVQDATSHYEWLIEELNQQKTVELAHQASLIQSLAEYEKDPVLYSSTPDQKTDKKEPGYYDSMVKELLESQQLTSEYSRSISYYESVIEGFRSSNVARASALEQADEYLASLSRQVNDLIDNVSTTANEYYQKAAFVNTVQVLVPAVAASKRVITDNTIKMVAVVEVVILLAYLALAVAKGLKDANPRRPRAA